MNNIFDITTDWLVMVVDHGAPSEITKTGKAEKARQELINIWSQYVKPIVEPGEADFEDFYEQAARLEAAVKVFKPEHVWLTTSKNPWEARNLKTGTLIPAKELAALRRWGSQPSGQEPLVSLDSEKLADKYASLKAFQNNAGRQVILATEGERDSEKYTNLMRAIRHIAETDMTQTGADHGNVFVKVNKAKYGIFPLHIPKDLLVNGAGDLFSNYLMNEMDWTLVNLEEVKNGFLVQAQTTMEYEYRFLVGNHEVATGAGCIEEYTPLDNLGEPFDPQMRRNRLAKDPIEYRPDLVGKMLTFAREVAAQVKSEVPKLNNYSLDIALSDTGEPMVIEMNGLLNSGLYATQPALVAEALTRSQPILGDPYDSLFAIRGTITRIN